MIKNMAHTSGALKWAQMLKKRIETKLEVVCLLCDMSVKKKENTSS